jgi:rhodanese-related sulfurtransferase
MPENRFAAEHLPGSVNICVYETAFIDKIRAAFPDPNTALIVYGLNDSTLEAGVALIKLGAAGYAQVTALPGGLEGWKAGGGKIEQSGAPELPSGQFEVGLRAKLGEFKLKYEALAKDAGISEKTVCRAIKGEEVDEATKQSIVGSLGTSIEMLEWLGRSRILSRISVPPEQKEKDVYELTEILDAHHLFRALSGKIEGYGISLPQLETLCFFLREFSYSLFKYITRCFRNHIQPDSPLCNR